MSLALFHYLMLNIFRMLIHPSSGACDLFDVLFHGLYCSGWLGLCGIRMQAEALVLQPASGYHTTPAKPQHNTNTSNQSNTTHEITNKSQAPEDGCINIRNMLSIK